MTRIRDLHNKWMKDPEYRAEYHAAKPTFELMMVLSEARVNAGLTQEQLAQRMCTTQSAVARLEGWTTNPSVKTLERYAEATGTRLRISFEPVPDDQSPVDEDETRVNGAASTDGVEVDVAEPSAVST